MKVIVRGRAYRRGQDSRQQLMVMLADVGNKIRGHALARVSTPEVFLHLDQYLLYCLRPNLFILSERDQSKYHAVRPTGAVVINGYWIDSVNKTWTFTIDMYGRCDIELKD